MPRPIIPPDAKGYMLVDGKVHTRYATHCPRGMRVRSADEAFAALARTQYTVCETCYPGSATRKPRARKAPPQRRAAQGRR